MNKTFNNKVYLNHDLLDIKHIYKNESCKPHKLSLIYMRKKQHNI